MKCKLHLFSWLLFAMALLAPVKTMAQVQIGNFTYTFSGTEATIVASTLTGGNIVIPETVVRGGKTYPVTALKYNTMLFKGFPTSITGKSIRRIEGGDDGTASIFYLDKMRLCKTHSMCASIDFPRLVSLKKCVFLDYDDAITSINLPELEVIEKCAFIMGNCPHLSSISMPKLKTVNAYSTISMLPALTSLNLPELTEVSGNNVICDLPLLNSLTLPKLKKVANTMYSLSQMATLQTLHLPELFTIENGYDFLSYTPKLQTLSLPKVHDISGTWFLRYSGVATLHLPSDCVVSSVGMMAWPDASVSSITITGMAEIRCGFFAAHGSTTLKHISFPDVVELHGQIGIDCEGLESFSAPKLKKIVNSTIGGSAYAPISNFTTVDIHNVEEINGSNLFVSSPVTSLTLRGDLKVDASSAINLKTYPTVVTITDEGTVSDIPASAFANVKGGRFITPKGKAVLYAAKWNLNTAKTMVYAPVELKKSTAGSLYASGCITKADASYTYGGTTYTNQYDFSHAMTAAECLDPQVLSDNDLGFTPTLASLSVHNNINALTGFNFYYANAYTDTPTYREGDLTLSTFPTTPAAGTLQGFGTSAVQYGQGIGRDVGGFLFKGNGAAVTEVYLPYTPTAATLATNYLKVGEGTNVKSHVNNSHTFYWHPGDAAFPMGFYECDNTLVPDGRAYLSLSNSMTSNAKQINLIFEDGGTTDINRILLPDDGGAPMSPDNAWYTLSGMRLSAKPVVPGIYIHGGRKVVIR